MKLVKMLTKAKTALHAVAIIASACASALAAMSVGGDPALGASIGAVANTSVALLTA